MNGFFYIDKQSDWTSRDVSNKVQKIFNLPKVGHIGTLDPFATGLLIVCVGSGTKASTFFNDDEKEYIATLSLGQKTATGDLTGEVVEEKDIKPFTEKDIKEVFTSFIGEIEQVVPMTSAVHVNGVKLYQYLHKGVEVERPVRKVCVKSLELLSYDNKTITFKAVVSKGTYIRVLGEDIADRLGTVGHLIALRRTKVGSATIEKAKTLDQVKKEDLISIKDFLCDIPHFVLCGDKLTKAKHGMTIPFEGNGNSDRILILDENDVAIAMYRHDHQDYYKCLRGLL